MAGRRRQDDQKRERFFQAGASSLAAFGLISAPNRYVCPQCVRAYIPEAVAARVLTLEHVPSRRLGGKAITLTCNECNPRAGAKLDGALSRERRLEDFVRGGPGRWRGTLVTDDDRGAAVMIVRDNDRTQIAGQPQYSHPDAHKTTFEYFDKHVNKTDWRITLRFLGYNPRHAAVGHLRTGYLAAFAMFGYTTVLNPLGARIRSQIANPDSDELGGFVVTMSEPVDPSTRHLVVCEKPFPCLAAQIGRRAVILPWPPSGVDPYALLQKQPRGSVVSMQGEAWPWPTGMELVLDKRVVAERGPLKQESHHAA